MKPEQQRIAIAQSCGWTSVKEVFEDILGRPPNTSDLYCRVPSYTTDLNAMHEVVKTLPQNLKPRYFAWLCTVASGAISLHGYSEATEATAAQRAEAFLKTLNLWKQ